MVANDVRLVTFVEVLIPQLTVWDSVTDDEVCRLHNTVRDHDRRPLLAFPAGKPATLLLDSGVLGSNVAREVPCLFKITEKEGLQGGKYDKNEVGQPQHVHDPGIQQEPP
jgi:hypothetical protein